MTDFRSDTVTQPTAAMKAAMLAAPLGDDVFQDDPTVNELQRYAAELLGFEAALFAPSGTQTNLIALMAHCQRGDEAIVGQQWHTYRWEAGGMAVLGSIQPQPLEHQADGTLALEHIRAAVKPDDPHFARTKLIVMENTTGGKVLPLAYMNSVATLAKELKLNCHIDGARLMNAAVALATADGSNPIQKAKQLCAGFDSVSLCLSKGLGAPIGSVLVSDAETMHKALRIRKIFGGNMRQSGYLAAAGIFALQNNINRLEDDHRRAKELGQLLQQLPWVANVSPTETNIVIFEVKKPLTEKQVIDTLKAKGILISSMGQGKLRMVTHLDYKQVLHEYVLENLGKVQF